MTAAATLKGHRLLRLSVVSLAIAAVILIGVGIQLYRSYTVTRRTIVQQLQLKELAGTIVHLDEVLTMSARMAAVTGNLEWEARYRKFEPLLSVAIERALQVGGAQVTHAISLTDVANVKLVEMENRGFELVRAGRLAEAQAVLFGDEYDVQKQVYSSGIEQATTLLKQQADTALTKQWAVVSVTILLTTAILVFLFCVWLAVLWTMRRWQQTLLAQYRQLQEFNRTLDHKVAERTEGFERSNAELARRELVMQSLLEDLEGAKQRIEEQARTLQASNTKLRELTALKDEFVAKVSHELRTPLTSIKEGLSLLLDKALGDITPDQQDFLTTMDNDIDRLAELINNMLDLSKIEAGRMRLQRGRTDVKALLETVARTYQAILGRRTLRVECDEVPPIFADTHRVIQVLTNLLSNAIKFTPDDGTITFRVSRRNQMVAIAVTDSGPGITPEDIARLFQKFSQVGSQGGGAPRGTGLGLVVCKELTELHGGRIEVTSEVGTGTTFTVLLPIYTEALALSESFRELLDAAAGDDGHGVGMVAIHAGAVLQPAGSPEARSQRLGALALEVRQRLHRGDIVLTLEPEWIIAMAATNADGVQAIVRRLRGTLQGAPQLRFGAALHPHDGADGTALFHAASANLERGLCYNEAQS